MAELKAVIFDLDGTLLDTLEDLTDSVNEALCAYGRPVKTIRQIQTYVGNGIRNLMKRSVEDGEADPDFEHIFQAFRRSYQENCRNKTKPYDGITELLRTLESDGKKMAIVSNKADYAVKELNEYYFKEFGMTAIGERENIARKPSPDTVLEALKELNVKPEEAVYIGDSEVDVETARNAKIPCISVLWGFREKDLLLSHGAEYFARRPDEVPGLLKNIPV